MVGLSHNVRPPYSFYLRTEYQKTYSVAISQHNYQKDLITESDAE